jgi:hypothetical protein
VRSRAQREERRSAGGAGKAAGDEHVFIPRTCLRLAESQAGARLDTAGGEEGHGGLARPHGQFTGADLTRMYLRYL